MPPLNLLVIRSKNPRTLKEQYEQLGFQFQEHQHEKGPMHYAHEETGFVFEIYPLKVSMQQADDSLRMGFSFKNLNKKLEELRNTNWKILSEPQEMPWGKVAIIQDLDGRKIELKET